MDLTFTRSNNLNFASGSFLVSILAKMFISCFVDDWEALPALNNDINEL